MELQELVAITENLTDDCQRVLHQSLKEIIYRQKGPANLKQCAELSSIVDIGMLEYKDGRYAIPELAKKNIRKLYTYLIRKFDNDTYFDVETGAFKDIPKGAIFTATVSIDGSIESGMQFPDDEVTELLNLFGTNRCNNWPL